MLIHSDLLLKSNSKGVKIMLYKIHYTIKGNKIIENPKWINVGSYRGTFKFFVSQTQYSKDLLNNNPSKATSGGFFFRF